jgi:hypothetical protein
MSWWRPKNFGPGCWPANLPRHSVLDRRHPHVRDGVDRGRGRLRRTAAKGKWRKSFPSGRHRKCWQRWASLMKTSLPGGDDTDLGQGKAGRVMPTPRSSTRIPSQWATGPEAFYERNRV